LALAGWTLEDENGNSFMFPLVTLYVEGGTVSVYSKSGSNTVLDLFWGSDEPVWAPGEQVVLRDSGGSVRAVYQIP
jgi:micrococcal nuclease